jgi:hypothetical protein
MFYLDLDEIDNLTKRLWFLSRNRFNLFGFKDSDHLELPLDNPVKGFTVKQNISRYLLENGVTIGNGKIKLITHLRTFGHIFNPVSFYFCYDEVGEPLCSVVEVCNTYREMKLYFIPKENLVDGKFHLNTTKYFYVSPFIELDTNFDFNLHLPADKLNVRIDDFSKDGNRFFISTLTGVRKVLNNWNLMKYAVRFPFITLQVIYLIHWQALKLWLKKIPYHKKGENMHLQQQVLKPYKS